VAPPARAHTLLLTGWPGTGKTTALCAVAARLTRSTGARVRGFYTEEIRAGGQRRGFRGVTFDGLVREIAHVRISGGPRVGRYGVDVAAVDALAEHSLEAADDADVVLVDEIGRMECLSPRFVAALSRLLDARRPLVATVAARGGGFIAEVKARADVEIRELTRANRDAAPGAVLAWLAARGVLT
jgi:nucleoside-triphosphatase